MQVELINPTYDAEVFHTAVKQQKNVAWFNVSNLLITRNLIIEYRLKRKRRSSCRLQNQ